jgi:hypothetical protein
MVMFVMSVVMLNRLLFSVACSSGSCPRFPHRNSSSLRLASALPRDSFCSNDDTRSVTNVRRSTKSEDKKSTR